ncbi:hypothetical protein OAA67_05855 [Winogradskyella sp.]|nr:hypothetical protein [Winogradskyella sp.]MDB9755699.1 hypothetical protein [Winogradskyella sp.]MDC1504594.1 hypothetical protein [Winogradskyella sp.]
MIGLAILGFLFVACIHFALLRISISCMYWWSNNSSSKADVFKICFPYYIITLSVLCLTAIVMFHFAQIAIIYFSFVYLTALLMWRHDLKKEKLQDIIF